MDTLCLIGALPVILGGYIHSWDIVPLFITIPVCIAIAVYIIVKRIRFVGADEQLKITGLTSVYVVNGPSTKIMPFLMKDSVQRKAITLGVTEYCVVQDTFAGTRRVEEGPKLLFLGPFDEAEPSKQVISLKKTEYVRLLDRSTGQTRVEIGEQGRVIPRPTEDFLDNRVCTGMDLKSNEFVKIEDKMTGTIRVERGEKIVFLEQYEQFLSAKQQAMDLKCNQWVKVEDSLKGTVRTERGEKLVFLNAMESFVSGKREAIDIDENTSVLIRNNRTGQQSLITENQAFFPADDEDVIEQRNRVKLADYESIIVSDVHGNHKYYFGKNEAERSFFLPPYNEFVKMCWSAGRRRERRDLIIEKIDLRPMYMSFEFDCRTADNVELILEGSFFWEITDLKAMNTFCNDATGDVCNHARSKFIEKVSKVTLQEFMGKFNQIAEEVHSSSGQQDNFYQQRGVLIHSLEVTGYKCQKAAVEEVLGQIIMETTNRMNRLQKQESENEVALQCIHGDIAEEKARTDLLKIQADNYQIKNAMDGAGESEKVIAFLTSLEKEVPVLDTRVKLWNTLRKQDALGQLANGKVATKMYFTPEDCNLAIENHE